MAALKWIVVVLCTVAAAGALAMGVIDALPARARQTFSTPPLSLRTFAGGAPAVAPPVEAAAPEEAAPAAPEAPELEAIEPIAAPKTPVVDGKEKKPVVAKPSTPSTPAPAPVAAGGGDGVVNLRASDTADVFLDGKKVGGSPVLGLKVKAGAHKARFDCYDSAGNTIPGAIRAVTVVANEEADVEFTCPVE